MKSVAVCTREHVLNNIPVLLQEAEQLIKAKNILAARNILNEIMRYDSQNVVCLTDLSVCDILEGKSNDAVKKLNVALSIDPGNKIVLENIDYLRTLLKKPESVVR